MTTTILTGIGRLVTHDPAQADHATAASDATTRSTSATMPGMGAGLDNAWLVVDGSHVAATGDGIPPAADTRIDLGGRAVIPGFVDSHTHLVFAGDRSAEFAARMAGADYEAGGITTTMAATATAWDADLRRLLQGRVAASRAAGITTREIKSGYAGTVDGEARLLRLAGEVTDHTTYLGAHVVPPGHVGDTDDYVDVVTGPMLAACAPLATSIDVFCEVGAFDRDQSLAVLRAGRAAGLVPRVHANQLGPGPGVAVAVEVEAASADHCTHLTDDDVAALAGSDTVATLLPATDFSTRQPYPDARRLVDAGATVALATNANPGSSHTTSMGFVLALAVRDCHLTVDEAIWAATMGGARSLRRDDIGHLRPGAIADLAVLDAPGPSHFVYRPGMPVVMATIEAGQLVAGSWPAPA
ncbi:MAG TPA: imidazolonepropionase [Nitriliruptoraceae bacterium]|nr:imidazolonepropionase [Nitriliruptoraceae bacterium]